MLYTTIRILVLLIGTCCCYVAFGQAMEENRCATMPNLERLERLYPAIKERMQGIEQHTQAVQHREKSRFTNAEVIRIPVVFHVLYHTEEQNISDELIHSQLQVLNEDFRRLNRDTVDTPSIFADRSADVGVEFCLATVDPNGFQTSGITRTYTAATSFSTDDYMKFSAYGGKDAWNTQDYLNIWICNLSRSTLGYAQFPGGPAETDGVVLDYLHVGLTYSTQTIYNQGRTATHEVGHWLNLRHIWGDGDCDIDDFVDDTPAAGQPNHVSACYSSPINSCEEENDLPDMFQNYMDYSADVCMNLFTKGQTDRMRALFAPGGFRESLRYSKGCSNIGLPVSCTDGFQNGDEQGVDCGGSQCSECEPAYCTVRGNADYEWIEEVRVVSTGTNALPSFSHTSGSDGGYGNYSDREFYVEPGATLQVELIPGFESDTYAEHWKVWIDFNQNKDFSDPGELVFEADEIIGAVVATQLLIPDTVQGRTTMRIGMNYTYFNDSNSSGCGIISYGEVEDYTIVFTACRKPVGLKLLPRLHEESARIAWDSLAEATEYELEIYAVGEATPRQYHFTTERPYIDLENIQATSSYIFYYKLRARCPQGWTAYTIGNLVKNRGAVQRTAEAELLSIQLHPIPASNLLSLRIASKTPSASYTCRILDATGKLMLHTRLRPEHGTQLDIATLPAGVYTLLLSDEKETVTARFIKL